jgi:hypothetical protein
MHESDLRGQFIGLLNNRNRRDSPKESFRPLMLILHFIVSSLARNDGFKRKAD